MKKLFILLYILAGTLLLAGCKDSETSDIEVDPADERVTRPTDWITADALDPSSFMIVDLTASDMPTTINAKDLLAAFVGEECRGVAEPIQMLDGGCEFTMLLMASMHEERNNEDVVLKYYSEEDGAIYLSKPIVFQPFENWRPAESEKFKSEWKRNKTK